MGRRSRVNDQRFGIPDVGKQREELEGVDQLLACIEAAFNSEGDERALAAGQILLRPLVIGTGLEAGIVDPLHAGMLRQMLGDRQGVLRVTFQTQV